MKALALAPVLALAAFTLAAPPLAEAAHRHGRDCGHRGYSSRDYRPAARHHRHTRHCRSHCDRGYAGRYSRDRGYTSRYYGAYGYRDYGSVPYYDSGYYGYIPPPPPRVYRHRRHHRPRVGIYIGF